MTTDKEFVLESMRRQGRAQAESLQAKAGKMTGTELNAQTDYIPPFSSVVQHLNMKERKVGFVCRSSAGRVVRLLQPYDSNVFPQEPEDLPAQWGFAWSTDPDKALPFIQSATSPYNKGECCTDAGGTYSSLIDANVHSPSAYPAGWKRVK